MAFTSKIQRTSTDYSRVWPVLSRVVIMTVLPYRHLRAHEKSGSFKGIREKSCDPLVAVALEPVAEALRMRNFVATDMTAWYSCDGPVSRPNTVDDQCKSE